MSIVSCGGKVAFDTWRSANTAATRTSHASRRRVRLYHCEHCGKYHVGYFRQPRKES